jgi:hypothetical protein
MSNSSASTAPFASSNQPSLAALIERIKADATLSSPTRQSWCWAIRLLARLAGREPRAIPAHPDHLRRLMAKLSPGSAGIGKNTWNNARSLVGKAMSWAGLAEVPGRYQCPFTPAWAALWAKLPPGTTALAYQL